MRWLASPVEWPADEAKQPASKGQASTEEAAGVALPQLPADASVDPTEARQTRRLEKVIDGVAARSLRKPSARY